MNKYPDIDIEIASLKFAVEEKANILLAEISEDNLRTFVQGVKLIANGKMEKYIFKVYDLYADGALQISDYDILVEFTNYRTGYQGQMLAWIDSNPIEVREQSFTIPAPPASPQIHRMKPMITVGVGSAVAIGLYVFSNSWVALAEELLTLALGYKYYRNNTKRVDQFEYDCKTYESELRKLKRQLVDELIDDLVKWMQLGKLHSDSILESYKL